MLSDSAVRYDTCLFSEGICIFPELEEPAMWPNGKKGVRRKGPAWGNRLRAAWAPPFLLVWLFLVLALTGCATVPGLDEEVKKPEPLRLPVALKAVPRRVLVAPRDEVIWLWNKPGGTASGSVRVGKLPPGTRASSSLSSLSARAESSGINWGWETSGARLLTGSRSSPRAGKDGCGQNSSSRASGGFPLPGLSAFLQEIPSS